MFNIYIDYDDTSETRVVEFIIVNLENNIYIDIWS